MLVIVFGLELSSRFYFSSSILQSVKIKNYYVCVFNFLRTQLISKPPTTPKKWSGISVENCGTVTRSNFGTSSRGNTSMLILTVWASRTRVTRRWIKKDLNLFALSAFLRLIVFCLSKFFFHDFQTRLLPFNGRGAQFIVMPKYKVNAEGEPVSFKIVKCSTWGHNFDFFVLVYVFF